MTDSSPKNNSARIVHIVYRFDYGGLENGLVNLINSTQGTRFRHSVVALTVATEFKNRLTSRDVTVHALDKKPGKDLGAHVRLYKLLRRLRPVIVHSRNIGTIDCAAVAKLAGVPVTVHGEHGWDIHDPDGISTKYRRLRRMLSPFVNRFIAVSVDLRDWLIHSVGIDSRKVTHICNGVDSARFSQRMDADRHPELEARFARDTRVIGSVLRFEGIKDPMNLVQAFITLTAKLRKKGIGVGLVMIGDGPLRSAATSALDSAGLQGQYWLPGSRDDVAQIMRSLDVFVLGSRREGISNTILEAMASGLPVIATNTGGNLELVASEATGLLVPVGDPPALAEAIRRYVEEPALGTEHGVGGRKRVEQFFSMSAMIDSYKGLYEELLGVDQTATATTDR